MDWLMSLILIIFVIIYYCIPAILIIMLPIVIKEIVGLARKSWLYIKEEERKNDDDF